MPAGLLLAPRLPNSDDMVAVFGVDGEGDGGGLVSSRDANLTRFGFATLPSTMTRAPMFSHGVGVSEALLLDIVSCSFLITFCPLQLAFSCLVSGICLSCQQLLSFERAILALESTLKWSPLN